MIEADAEVSEAIDFASYLRRPPRCLQMSVPAPGCRRHHAAVEFPLATPRRGAAGAGGGKCRHPQAPPETVAVAYRLASIFGRPASARCAEFFPCPTARSANRLSPIPRVSAVVLTGAYDTARMFLDWRPPLQLSRRDQREECDHHHGPGRSRSGDQGPGKSAFGHAGQECSRASLAILEAEVYDDPAFRRLLCDAAEPECWAGDRSGPAWSRRSSVCQARLCSRHSPSRSRRDGLGNHGRSVLTLSSGSPVLRVKPQLVPENRGLRARLGDPRRRPRPCHPNPERLGLRPHRGHRVPRRKRDRPLARPSGGGPLHHLATTGAIVQRQPFGGWSFNTARRQAGGRGRLPLHPGPPAPRRLSPSPVRRGSWGLISQSTKTPTNFSRSTGRGRKAAQSKRPPKALAAGGGKTSHARKTPRASRPRPTSCATLQRRDPPPRTG